MRGLLWKVQKAGLTSLKPQVLIENIEILVLEWRTSKLETEVKQFLIFVSLGESQTD